MVSTIHSSSYPGTRDTLRREERPVIRLLDQLVERGDAVLQILELRDTLRLGHNGLPGDHLRDGPVVRVVLAGHIAIQAGAEIQALKHGLSSLRLRHLAQEPRDRGLLALELHERGRVRDRDPHAQ